MYCFFCLFILYSFCSITSDWYAFFSSIYFRFAIIWHFIHEARPCFLLSSKYIHDTYELCIKLNCVCCIIYKMKIAALQNFWFRYIFSTTNILFSVSFFPSGELGWRCTRRALLCVCIYTENNDKDSFWLKNERNRIENKTELNLRYQRKHLSIKRNDTDDFVSSRTKSIVDVVCVL